jgi:hypothetical protein
VPCGDAGTRVAGVRTIGRLAEPNALALLLDGTASDDLEQKTRRALKNLIEMHKLGGH